MASSSKADKPVRGILKTSKHESTEVKLKRRKLPSWMTDNSEKRTERTAVKIITIPSSCNIIYSHNENDCTILCQNLIDDEAQRPLVVGFDIEWPVTYQCNVESKTAVIQVCDDPNKRCFVFHVCCMSGLPLPLRMLIESNEIIKVGLNIEGDLYKLCRDFDVIYPRKGFVDLGQLTNSVNKSNEKWSLAGLVMYVFSRELDKPADIRKGKWEYPLSKKQLEYAALDAVVSLMLYTEMKLRETMP